MGIFGALFAGVSGLNSQSNKIGQISNNIANVNTVGFKEETAAFNSLVVPSGTTTFSPGGVISSNQQLVSKQGLIQGTASGTDLAISGNGFFAVNTSATAGEGQLLYTRVGSFTQDASGNFVNANGMFLQGWALTSTGAKPGNSTDPTTSLSTVRIQSNASGVATPTTNVAISANLNASLLPTSQGGQPILLGAGETVGFNANNTSNASNNATSIIVGNDYDSSDPNLLVRGDQFQIQTNGTSSTTGIFTYGGFTVGRSITNTGITGSGDSATENALLGSSVSPAGVTAYLNKSNIISFTGGAAGPTTITMNVPSTGLKVGQEINISGIQGSSLGGIPVGLLNTTQTITAVNTGVTPNTIQFVVNAPGATTTVTNGGGTGINVGAFKPQSFLNQTNPFTTVSSGSGSISVTAPNNGYAIGQIVDIEGATGTIDGIPSSAINGKQIVTGVSASGFTFTASGATATAGSVNGGGTGVSFANRTYPFAGNILDATSASGDFLTNSTTAPFDPNALSFQISTTSNGTFTFKYVTGTPDPSQGQFNTLSNLVNAINDTSGLTARVVNGRLYVGATDANQGITFINGQLGDTSSGKGIDWKGELGLEDVPQATTIGTTKQLRFDSLNSLAAQINTYPAFTATVNQPTSASTISINSSDPKATIDFQDIGSNTGSILAELGFKDNGNSPLTLNVNGNPALFDTGTFAVKYDPNDANKNMSGGKVTPQFTRNITIYDSLGVSHTIAFNTAKIGVNTWAVEMTAVPVTDLGLNARPDGQLAAGTIVFNGDGTLNSVQPNSLKNFSVDWIDGASTSTLTMDFGTLNKTNGLSQFAAASNATLVKQDGSSAGQLTGVSIDSDGYVIESFSNGQSQKVFKVPLISVDNPNGLEAVSGNAFKDTQASGAALSVDAGTNGTGGIQSSALEQSTVDLSSQLTNLIVAQQAYGANSKLLTVADQLLQQLDQIIQ
ncbi:MAG TPA: flagellar hook-basal body complex protein [Rickettsiales bacterium]|nr:flagellar hook-basal body complex protein [Rickettsiales bacterium]